MRAGEVIDRMRTLLRREEVAMTSLAIEEVLGDVGTLLRPDAEARHVALHLDVPAGLPPVHGDRVQIQQVLLNLILNGMDALEGAGHPDRSVTVAAQCIAPASVEISVVDRRPRHRGESAGAHLRAVLHHQVQRHRDGAVDLAQHRRKPPRPTLGREQRQPWRHVSLYLADRARDSLTSGAAGSRRKTPGRRGQSQPWNLQQARRWLSSPLRSQRCGS